tara:strand:- start:146 stop:466 length:321 start_codon:yes stop_codon:yes gene_type:complete
MKGIFGKIFGDGNNLLSIGANLLGIDSGFTDIIGAAGSAAFGNKGGSGGGSGGSTGGYTRAYDLGSSRMGTEQIVGPGQIKASTAVEFDDELAEAMQIVRNYAGAE